ncbi:hypothetical protein J421_4742 (plasmid) [Gemmatirosa kalamazoonensis]|uniref:Uncharacterized protein n=1 Tax=Gemmatirosa kalamazoonensis TaxID=861299 RepID=W0RP64_9BACT|nr:hypothetical protein [Gemmatirosa kalamazoonensis]AHG92277.1 hypothetical protein J421_4742 [Gemmatirosa kalamazoonensis]
MSVARFGTNILIDGGPRLDRAYNATVALRLAALALSAAGRGALAELARLPGRLWIVPPDAVPSPARGDVVLRYDAPPADHAGTMLLGALLHALQRDAATGQATGRRIQMPVRIVTPVGSAAPIL